jgi:hypothetical protein
LVFLERRLLSQNPNAHDKVVPKTLNMPHPHETKRRKNIVVKVSKVETTPELVQESNLGLFHATMNLPHAAAHCGMSQREMKMTFREFLKYNIPTDTINNPDH